MDRSNTFEQTYDTVAANTPSAQAALVQCTASSLASTHLKTNNITSILNYRLNNVKTILPKPHP